MYEFTACHQHQLCNHKFLELWHATHDKLLLIYSHPLPIGMDGYWNPFFGKQHPQKALPNNELKKGALLSNHN